MKLTAEQKEAVAGWLRSGASVADVQRRLREEFTVSLTYMDTRFLIDDLGLELAPPPPKKKAEPPKIPGAKTPPAAGASPDEVIDPEYVDEGDAFGDAGDEFADAIPVDGPAGAGGTVKVDIDRVMRPGAAISGSVTFSDGKSGTWALDQFGRLVFDSKTEGYRPSQADLQAFQRELSAQLQRHGY
ncbi:MAG: hypothetical protein ACREIA_02345 [Opitutaceae bacterium]